MNRRILRHSFTMMNVDHVKLNSKWCYKNVISPYFRIYLIDGGNGFIRNEERTCELEPGFLYIVPSFTLCDLVCESHLDQYFLHFFEDSANGMSIFHNNQKVIRVKATEMDLRSFQRLLQINPNRKINRSDNPKVYEKNIHYQEYEELNYRQDDCTFLESQGIILQLISRFLSSTDFIRRDISIVPARILDLIGFIDLNLSRRLTVSELAGRVNQNPDYFSRVFLQFTGERPLSYIHKKRIERAQYLLITTDNTISEISQSTGFDSIPHFTKVFKKITRLTPRQYQMRDHSIGML